jgi:serine/threonine protein kinase
MRICADVAAGLAAAHARGLVHRDVKPGNVIVAAGGAKLVDFGIAAAIGEPDLADEDGIMMGTPAYLAPERLEDGVVVPGSDVYALGLLLYRLLAGATPWSTQTTTQMLKAHAYLPPRRLPTINRVPAAVAGLCDRCLAKDPADRPPATEVAAVLTSAARTAPPRPVAPDLPTGSRATAGPIHPAGAADMPIADGAGSNSGTDEPEAGATGLWTSDHSRTRRRVTRATNAPATDRRRKRTPRSLKLWWPAFASHHDVFFRFRPSSWEGCGRGASAVREAGAGPMDWGQPVPAAVQSGQSG